MTFTIERIAHSATNYSEEFARSTTGSDCQAFDYLCQVSPFHHPNPTVIKPLKGQYKGLWRYRVGDIRIIYAIDKETRTIQVVEIDNRGNMYSDIHLVLYHLSVPRR